MKKTPIINDFRSGELNPNMDSRIDLKDYYRGCRILENAMPIIEGGVMRVPGSYYVRPVKQLEEGWNIRTTKSGDGTGIVTSDLVPGIDCGSDCYAFFIDGSTVILTATPDAGNTFMAWSGHGFSGVIPISVLMNGNKVINAEFSSILYNPYLIAWYKFEEGSGLVVENSATDGSDGGGLFPDLNVFNTGGGFWTTLSGFGSTVDKGGPGYEDDFAWAKPNRILSAGVGEAHCFGMFTLQRTALNSSSYCLSTKQTYGSASNYGWRTYFDNAEPGKAYLVRSTGAKQTANFSGFLDAWTFGFYANDGLYYIVTADGTIRAITSAFTLSTNTNFQYIFAGVGYMDADPPVNGGLYGSACSYGDWIIYDNIALTPTEWGTAWYDKLRSKYGMAARSGW